MGGYGVAKTAKEFGYEIAATGACTARLGTRGNNYLVGGTPVAPDCTGGDIGAWINLFNLTWKDTHNRVRHLVLPEGLTGVRAKIVVLLGRHFPTG